MPNEIADRQQGAAPRPLVRRAEELIFGRPPPAALPRGVRRAIAADQRASEILLCFVQFGAIAFFGAFYALTPKAFPPDVPFEPVPWALAVYALFTGLRLWLALRGRLTRPFLAASVIIDIAVLMITIWSFHIQYEAPATIYLKAPTLLYVFILIALRALRLEAWYVVLAGAAAIAGWFTLVAYAVVTAGDMGITHDFAEYMNSSQILIGAEVDKLISIAAVTAVLAVAVIRARRLLVRAAAEAHAAHELSRFLPPEVAGEIRGADDDLRPGAAHRREAAVMMVDMRGFTGWAGRLPPAETIALLGDYHSRIVPVIQRHGGAIDKYLGDGIMATFGAARPSETYAADALRALEDLLAACGAWNREREAQGLGPVGVGVAVAAGPVLFGVTGDASRLEFTVIGDPANLAAKLEKHCKALGRPGVVTRAALETARAQGHDAQGYEMAPGETVEGAGGPVDLAATGPAALARAA